ncbi:MAG: D-alanyl-D-alanine carboxypeptidase family protein [Frankiaceae bacterium]
MRSLSRLAVAPALAAALVVAPATPVLAAPADPGIAAAPVVGGPGLAAKGLVVDQLPGAPPLPKHLSASGWMVADLGTGEVLAARDPHGRYMPASTLKILTAVTLLPRLDPATVVRTSYEDAAVDGTKVGMVPGFGYTVRDLFTAMLVMSANDAARGLAEAYGGVPRTVRAMNAEARYLHATDTVARTPHGLDAPGQATSAYDLALLAKAGLAMPAFRHYVGIVSATFPAPRHRHYQVYTHDRLLVNYRGAIGVKDGYTVAARASFVGAATRHGHTLVVTLLHADPYCWHEAAALLDWGFAALGQVRPVGTLVAAGDATVPVVVAAPAPKAGTTGRTVAAAATRPAGSGPSGWLTAPMGAAVGAGLIVVLLAQSHLRRRRRYGRSRLKLPPI